MGAIQQTAAQQWNQTLSQLRESVQQAILHLQDLEAVAEASYDSREMGPEEWSEQSVDLEHFIIPGQHDGSSPEETVHRVFGLVRSALQAGDLLVNFEAF